MQPLFSVLVASPGCSSLSPQTTSALSQIALRLWIDGSHVPLLELTIDPFLMLPVNRPMRKSQKISTFEGLKKEKKKPKSNNNNNKEQQKKDQHVLKSPETIRDKL